jgi:lauroyl/myristoyl acyltransferase
VQEIAPAARQYFWLHRRWKHQPKPRGKKAGNVQVA